MAPPRDTAGSTTPHQFQQADAGPGRNQKSTTLRNATAEAGWFYPTPALCKAGADVRGARAARESCRLRTTAPRQRPRAGNAEAYYPHFQFDSNYTYGMVHRE